MVTRVCLVSSGTGGHLMPAVALGHALRDAGHETFLVTEGRAVENSLLARSGGEAATLPMSRGGLGVPVDMAKSVLRARSLLRRENIGLVVSTGGRTSVPVALAARTLGVPVCLLEQNARTGRANRWLRPLARRIYYGLPCRDALGPDARYTGTPLRSEVGSLTRAEARNELGLHVSEPVLLVTGGSQGAQFLNGTVPAAVVDLRSPVQILHLAGEGHDDGVRRDYAERCPGVRAVVRPIAMDMATLYAAADLVVCRGGGATVSELMASGRGAVIVPYPHHRDRQQWHNGEILEREGAATLVDQRDLTAPALSGILNELLVDRNQTDRMGERAAALWRSDPCAEILDDLQRQDVLH